MHKCSICASPDASVIQTTSMCKVYLHIPTRFDNRGRGESCGDLQLEHLVQQRLCYSWCSDCNKQVLCLPYPVLTPWHVSVFQYIFNLVYILRKHTSYIYQNHTYKALPSVMYPREGIPVFQLCVCVFTMMMCAHVHMCTKSVSTTISDSIDQKNIMFQIQFSLVMHWEHPPPMHPYGPMHPYSATFPWCIYRHVYDD